MEVVVHVLLGNPADLLLLRRAGTGRADGLWAPPGGHLEAGELPRAAAVRELFEETGVVLREADLLPVAALFFRDGRTRAPQDVVPGAAVRERGATGLNLLFVARLPAPVTVAPREGVADATGWWPRGALPAPRVPWLDDALARADRASPAPPDWFGEPAGG